eukprot:6541716-Prymnesium_polylepis.1
MPHTAWSSARRTRLKRESQVPRLGDTAADYTHCLCRGFGESRSTPGRRQRDFLCCTLPCPPSCHEKPNPAGATHEKFAFNSRRRGRIQAYEL